jgi:hypothetical protein
LEVGFFFYGLSFTNRNIGRKIKKKKKRKFSPNLSGKKIFPVKHRKISECFPSLFLRQHGRVFSTRTFSPFSLVFFQVLEVMPSCFGPVIDNPDSLVPSTCAVLWHDPKLSFLIFFCPPYLVQQFF